MGHSVKGVISMKSRVRPAAYPIETWMLLVAMATGVLGYLKWEAITSTLQYILQCYAWFERDIQGQKPKIWDTWEIKVLLGGGVGYRPENDPNRPNISDNINSLTAATPQMQSFSDANKAGTGPLGTDQRWIKNIESYAFRWLKLSFMVWRHWPPT